MSNAELCNELSRTARATFGDTAVEALVGALSTVVTDEQLKVLIEAWKRRGR
jgi:hypothetical protein